MTKLWEQLGELVRIISENAWLEPNTCICIGWIRSNIERSGLEKYYDIIMASDRMRKKIKDYAEIFGHIMRKHALIMRKLHRIMRKLKQVIKLIIRPVQCIYMLTVNP